MLSYGCQALRAHHLQENMAGRPHGSRSYSNALVKSPHYDGIIQKYSERFKASGYVPVVDFYKEVVEPLVPEFKYESFRVFIRKFEQDALSGQSEILPATDGTRVLVKKMLNADEASRRGIHAMLNIGAAALEELAEHPEKLSVKERAMLLTAAMKAQDSRIQATAKVRQDQRSQVAFDHVFGEAAYAEENA